MSIVDKHVTVDFCITIQKQVSGESAVIEVSANSRVSVCNQACVFNELVGKVFFGSRSGKISLIGLVKAFQLLVNIFTALWPGCDMAAIQLEGFASFVACVDPGGFDPPVGLEVPMPGLPALVRDLHCSAIEFAVFVVLACAKTWSGFTCAQTG